MLVLFLGQEDPPEKEMATYCSILAWKIPWPEEPGGLQSTRSQRVRRDWAIILSLSHSHSGDSLKNNILLSFVIGTSNTKEAFEMNPINQWLVRTTWIQRRNGGFTLLYQKTITWPLQYLGMLKSKFPLPQSWYHIHILNGNLISAQQHVLPH